jgi:hypothetical protein
MDPPHGLVNWDYGRRNSSRWPRGTLYLQKLALTSLTSGCRSVGIVHSRTQASGVFFFRLWAHHKMQRLIENDIQLPLLRLECPLQCSQNMNKLFYTFSFPNRPIYYFYMRAKRKAMKIDVVITVGYRCYQLHTTFYQYPPLTVKSIYRWNYWGSPVWVST